MMKTSNLGTLSLKKVQEKGLTSACKPIYDSNMTETFERYTVSNMKGDSLHPARNKLIFTQESLNPSFRIFKLISGKRIFENVTFQSRRD
jgi:hypothetical protein